MTKPHVAMLGLGVMGANLIRNIERNGFPCVVYNRTWSTTEKFIAAERGKAFTAARSLEELIKVTASPRQLFLMVKAGDAVDELIRQLLPILSPGDIVIDGGNSWFHDSLRREKECAAKGVHFLGVGISGGEEGALNGPSIMPGGPIEAWKIMNPLFEAISAKADGPCTAYMGPNGAGHFVKMVHNGIEYGDMQLIAEAYDVLRRVGDLKPDDLSRVFSDWNKGVLESFLIEITATIFTRRDDTSDGFLVDKILDKAGQKGTGKWTAETALDLGVPIPTLAAAVDARCLSSMKDERIQASEMLKPPSSNKSAAKDLVSGVHDALYCAKILAYAQGMSLLKAASDEWKWNLRLDEIARTWKGGCIIRAKFLDRIQQAYKSNSTLPNLLFDGKLRDEVTSRIGRLREIVSLSAATGVPIPAFSSSLAYFDSYRSRDLPQNLTQAQRDLFGAHTYERIDRAGVFHTEWEKK